MIHLYARNANLRWVPRENWNSRNEENPLQNSKPPTVLNSYDSTSSGPKSASKTPKLNPETWECKPRNTRSSGGSWETGQATTVQHYGGNVTDPSAWYWFLSFDFPSVSFVLFLPHYEYLGDMLLLYGLSCVSLVIVAEQFSCDDLDSDVLLLLQYLGASCHLKLR